MAQAIAKRRVLILGGNGRIGTMLRHVWDGDDMGLDLTFQTRSSDTVSDVCWNLFDPIPEALLQAPIFDCMIVLSGVVPKPDADFARNSDIGLASLAAAAQLGVGSVILASTSAVYGAYKATALREEDALHPVNDYGTSKQEMEQRCAAAAQTLSLGLCCLRIGNVAGADSLLVNAQNLSKGQRLTLDVFPDGGTPLRSYIGPETLAQALSSLVFHEGPLPPVLNVAVPRPVTMGALAQAAGVPFDLRPNATTAHQRITLDCSRLAQIHSFTPADSDPETMVQQWKKG